MRCPRSVRRLVLAGVDEAGRGPLCGPVVAAAVAVDLEGLKAINRLGCLDSKGLSPARREELFEVIRLGSLRSALACSSAKEVDELGVLGASLLAMRRAVLKLGLELDLVLVDGPYPIPNLPFRQTALVRGDERAPLVGAASVLAKVCRDRVMLVLDRIFPGYGLSEHKGYPTPRHREAIRRLGPTPQHRRSFRW